MNKQSVQSPTLNVATEVTRCTVIDFATDNVLGVPVRFLAWEPYFEGDEELPGREGVWYGWLCLSPRQAEYAGTWSVPLVDKWSVILMCPVYMDVTSGFPEVVDHLCMPEEWAIKSKLKDLLTLEGTAEKLTPAQSNIMQMMLGMSKAITNKTIWG